MRWIGWSLVWAVGCGKAPVETPPGVPVVPVAAPAPTTKKEPGPIPNGLVQLSDTKWQVTDTLLNQWTGDPDGLGRVRQEGEGWALVNIRQRDAWHLGMRSGDVILEVNGRGLANQFQLLGAYLALKNDTRFDVAFERNGQRLVHHYVVQ